MPPARVYFFGLLVWPRDYFLEILVSASVCSSVILVKEMSNFGNSRIETQKFGEFVPELLSKKRQLMALLM